MSKLDLAADCASCAALCCVDISFERSESFAFDKLAGVPCPNLTHAQRCAIHEDRARLGFQDVSPMSATAPGSARPANFRTRPRPPAGGPSLCCATLHELLWLLTEAAKLCPPGHAELHRALAERAESLETLSNGDAASLAQLDAASLGQSTRDLLQRVGRALGGRSGLARAKPPHGSPT